MNIENAKRIDGWMSEKELHWLAAQASTKKSIVEIGSFLGRSTRALADNTEGVVYAMDDWKGPRDIYIAKETSNTFYDQFVENMGDLIASGKVVPVRANHRELETEIEPDMVFIDGSHTYEDVKADVEFWKTRVNGGVLCGHDIDYLTVSNAVRDTLGDDFTTVLETNLWYRKTGFTGEMQVVKALNLPTTCLAIGLPFAGRAVTPEWAISLASQAYPLNMNVQTFALKGVETGTARNQIVKHAIDVGAKYLWFLDDDVAPPYFAVRRLIYDLEQADDDVMVAGGIYCTKTETPEPLVFRGDGEGSFWKWQAGQVFEVTSMGTGCMVIKTEIFKHLEKPYFLWVDPQEKELPAGVARHAQTDDIYFCEKVRKAGFRLIADGGVLCVHWDVGTGKHYMLPPDSYPIKNQLPAQS
jgi:hypothetical protein